MNARFRHLELNGGQVFAGPPWHLALPALEKGYADAQIDDYGGRRRSDFLWRQGTYMELRARFSHPVGELVGTAGFGFWNAPFGDPSIPWPTLPQAAWFFYASKPSDLPLALKGPGRGWFASTLDAATPRALMLAPLAPAFLVLNQLNSIRNRVWPVVRNRMGVSFWQLEYPMTEWHTFRLEWREDGCLFTVDGSGEMWTDFSPHGPLAFVCWIDNQYLTLTPTGRVRWGNLALPTPQWLQVGDLELIQIS
jgi:hypothetical protein